MAAGGDHSCARRAAGTVAGWGGNYYGQLGDGTTTNRLIPVAVSGLSDAAEIAAGSSHSGARRAAGTVACWGGTLTGTTFGQSVPVAVSGLSDAG